ncbi:hypothetical protein U1Q18_034963 [Sarracenia purpurea var. burkii]
MSISLNFTLVQSSDIPKQQRLITIKQQRLSSWNCSQVTFPSEGAGCCFSKVQDWMFLGVVLLLRLGSCMELGMVWSGGGIEFGMEGIANHELLIHHIWHTVLINCKFTTFGCQRFCCQCFCYG